MEYMGGKTLAARHIAAIINAEILAVGGKSYWEPFYGSSSIMPLIRCDRRFGSDLFLPIISLWHALQTGWEPPAYVSECDYKAARSLPDIDPLKAFAGFGCSWGGKYFGGYARSGDRIFAASAKRSLQKKKLSGIRDVTLWCGSYARHDLGYVDVIYCDPPYADTEPLATKSFNHHEFYGWVRDSISAGRARTIFISEYNCPIGDCVWESRIVHGGLRMIDRAPKRPERLYKVTRETLTKGGK